MGAAYFYHLTRKPLESTLPLLLGKARGAGWRCQVVGPNADRLAALDVSLWQGQDTGFLAHGLAGGKHDGDQPILLTPLRARDHDCQCALLIDGAAIEADDVKGLERTCILFDGNDENALQMARGQWKTLTDAGCAAQYWSEDSGNWQKKAEKNS